MHQGGEDDIVFTFPVELFEIYKKINPGKTWEEAVKNYRYGIIKSRGVNKVVLPNCEMVRMFEEAIRNIKTHINTLLQVINTHQIKYIFMVGGFSNAEVLQAKMKDSLPDIPVIVPPEVELAVVKGAVMHGFNPKAITSRKSKYTTYGIPVNSKYDKSIHDKSKKILGYDNKPFVSVFCKYVAVNDTLDIGLRNVRQFSPEYPDQKGVSIIVFTSDDVCDGLVYADDPRLECLGRLVLGMTGTGLDRSLDVAMEFGSTEFKVSAVQTSGCEGVEISVTFDFLGLVED